MAVATLSLVTDQDRAFYPAGRTRKQVRLPQRPETPAFQRFGEWADRVQIARDGSIHRLARWMSLQPNATNRVFRNSDAFWEECREANPSCFKEYRTVRLDRPSYFLPAGEVAFGVLENPVQVPDNPPIGVMMRHLEAMNAFPLAKFYFLRPVFDVEADFSLLKPSTLRAEAAGDQRVALQIARRFGWLHRTERWTSRQAERAGRFALNLAGRAIDKVIAQLSRSELLEWLDPAAVDAAGMSLARLANAAESEGRLGDAARFRASASELRRRINIDPVLCFELPERPGELWFESHWFEGADGRTYVHY